MTRIRSHPARSHIADLLRSHARFVAKCMLIAAIAIITGIEPNPALARQLSVARRIDIEVQIGDRNDLPGTLTLPRGAGPFPVVVLVHGSGAHDRDETIGANKPFRDIAHGLAERGIAVLRYEKRTYRYRRLLSDEQFTIDRETTYDALQAIAYLRQSRFIDHRRIFVLGHSQGGMLAPRIAGRAPDVAGVILLAAPARPLLDLLVEQHRRIGLLDDGVINDAEQMALRRLIEGARAIRAGLDPAGIAAADGPARTLLAQRGRRRSHRRGGGDPATDAAAAGRTRPAGDARRLAALASAPSRTPRGSPSPTTTRSTISACTSAKPGSLRSYQMPGKVSAEADRRHRPVDRTAARHA